MTAVTSAVLFRSESKGSGFHTNERPQQDFEYSLVHDHLHCLGINMSGKHNDTAQYRTASPKRILAFLEDQTNSEWHALITELQNFV